MKYMQILSRFFSFNYVHLGHLGAVYERRTDCTVASAPLSACQYSSHSCSLHKIKNTCLCCYILFLRVLRVSVQLSADSRVKGWGYRTRMLIFSSCAHPCITSGKTQRSQENSIIQTYWWKYACEYCFELWIYLCCCTFCVQISTVSN